MSVYDLRLRKVGEKQEITDAEWRQRVELAACYRLIERFRMTDLVYNHITARVPGNIDAMLINPYGLHYSEITASNLVKIDMQGNIIDGSDYELNRTGYVIHSAILNARPDVVCVLHTHSPAGVVVSCLKDGFTPINQDALQFYGDVAYHAYEGIANNLEERERLASDLGDKHAYVLRNHGLITVGDSVRAAFSRMYYLEQGCRIQLEAMQSGGEIDYPSNEVCEHAAQQYREARKLDGQNFYGEWPALLRLLDRTQPDYKD